MALSARETRRLAEVTDEISQIENRLRVSHGLGDSHSSQGLSATFNDNAQWRNRLSLLRSVRDALEAKQAGECPPPAPGVTVTRYIPTVASGDGIYHNA